jgi:hypothetical protein
MEAQVEHLYVATLVPIDLTGPHRWKIDRTHLFTKVDLAFWATCVP